MKKIADDYPVPEMTLEEIENAANILIKRAGLLPGDWIDVDAFMSELNFKLVPRKLSEMKGAELFADAASNSISITSELSRKLRANDEKVRYTWGHEIGHLTLHRGPGLKARKSDGGNTEYSFIPKHSSAESQAWKFSRALFVHREYLLSPRSNADLAKKSGIPDYAIAKRRDDVRETRKLAVARAPLKEVEQFLKINRDPIASKAWHHAATLPGEDPGIFRLANGYKINLLDFLNAESQFGWTVLNDKAVSFLDLQSR